MRRITMPDRGVIDVTGALAADCGRELAEHLRVLTEEAFYSEIVLHITSPGGAADALREYVRAARAAREAGATIATHVPSSAGSAAAVMASLGDVRTAAPGASLRYHIGRVVDAGDITAHGAAQLHARLAEVDVWQVSALAERAGRAPARSGHRAKVRDFAPSDWPVIARLVGTAEATRRKMLSRLRERVAQAIESRAECGRLYGLLLDLDMPISAHLAAELRLIDRVGEPLPASSGAGRPCVRVPEWTALHRDGRVPQDALCRHTLIMGETGSGKSASGILPVVSAMLADDSPLGAMLIVDPKDEIGPAIARMGGSADVRVIDLATDSIDLMAGQHSIAEDLSHKGILTAAGRILRRAASFDSSNPARTLDGGQPRGSDPYWQVEGARLAVAVMASALLVHTRADDLFGSSHESGILADMGDPTPWAALVQLGERMGLVARDPEIESLVAEHRRAASLRRFEFAVRQSRLYRDSRGFRDGAKALIRSAGGSAASRVAQYAEQLPLLAAQTVRDSAPGGPSLLAVAGDVLQSLWTLKPARNKRFSYGEDEGGSQAGGEFLLAPVARFLARDPRFRAGETGKLLGQIDQWWCPLAAAERQYLGLVGTARTVFSAFSDPVPARALRVGIEPGRATIDFRQAVDNEAERTVYVYRAGLRREDALIARTVKARFFEAVLDSQPRRQRDDMPLAVYVADEFHRFVTGDQSHGEQSYIDTCRSQGGACILATQSVASLQHALAELGSSSSAEAVRILMANTATKMVFRSTETGVRELVESLCPGGPDRLPVATIRPPSTLRPGECYAALPDGRFERRQLAHWLPRDARQGVER